MQMKCKYHANKLLPGGAGLGAEGAGRGLLSRGPPLSAFLSLLWLPTPTPTPWCCPPSQAITFWEQRAVHLPRAPFQIHFPNLVTPGGGGGGDRVLKEEPGILWMGLG